MQNTAMVLTNKLVSNSDDFELYSSTSKGAIQGYGYKFHTGEVI
jgi:hypothetical protein